MRTDGVDMEAERSTEPSRSGTWQDRIIRGVALATVAYTAYYIGWRWTSTLNLEALWFSVPLAAGETWGFVSFVLLVFTTWKLTDRPPVLAPEDLDVDVFVTTYDEPIPVLRKTVVAAAGINYPHGTWILDDGCRDEVRELAQRLGVGYIPREESEHAKAGNLNNALAFTRADFILQLDADHVPMPHILDRLLGYFHDPKVAFVQSPQDFYNMDSFTHVVDEQGRRVWEEQRIFFDIIQPGKDHWNAAFFCGSCGVIRRAALDDIGGFSTETITEDMETSMKLHARGWKSVYVPESLAFGLSPGSAAAYQVQRLRWGQGSMQMLRKMNPLTFPGLSWPQRLQYFASTVTYFDGVQKLLFLAAPVIFFFTGVLPVDALDFEFLIRFFPYLFLMILSFELLTRGRGYLWLSERFNMAKFPVYLRAVTGLFRKGRIPFEVTPKGDAGGVPLKVYAPQLLVLVLAAVSLIFGTVAYDRGWIDYGAPGWRSAAFVLNGAWLVWNAVFAWQVVRMSRRGTQEEDYRFREEVPVRFHVTGRTGLDALPGLGITYELSPTRIGFLSATGVIPRERVTLLLPLTTGDRRVQGRVTSRKQVRQGEATLWDHQCVLENLPTDAEVAIELHCLHHAVPEQQHRFMGRPDVFEDLRRFFRERRSEPRTGVRLPAQVRRFGESGNGPWRPAVLEELSTAGARIVVAEDYPAGTTVQFQVPGIDVNAQGETIYSRVFQTPLDARHIIGIRQTRSLPPS